jgi:hypothetical protein
MNDTTSHKAGREIISFWPNGKIRSEATERTSVEQLEKTVGDMLLLLSSLLLAGAFTAGHYGALKYVLLFCGLLLLSGCISVSTTKPAPASTVTRTETVYVTENGTRVRRVVTVDASGRRYYEDNGRTIYVDHYEY